MTTPSNTPFTDAAETRRILAAMRDTAGDRRRHTGQSGMTLLETVVVLLLTSLMVLPIFGWTTFAMAQQRQVKQRNLNGTSLSLLRTYFTRDVANAEAATAEGVDQDLCPEKNSTTLFALTEGEQTTLYAVIDDGSATSLVRRSCETATGKVGSSTVLLDDVSPRDTSAQCLSTTGVDAAARSLEPALAGFDLTERDRFTNGGVSAVGTSAEDGRECRRITLDVGVWNSGTPDQGVVIRTTTLTASLRTGARTAVEPWSTTTTTVAPTTTTTVAPGTANIGPPSGFRLQKVEPLSTFYRIEFSWESVPGFSNYQTLLTCVDCASPFERSIIGKPTSAIFEPIAKQKQTYVAKGRVANSAGEWGPWSDELKVVTP